MRAECQFAKAGQGLFYNGILVTPKGQRFSFVYDCGTSNAKQVLSNSISEYKSLIHGRLNLLFISHLHDDHVSGIPELIRDVAVDAVVLPEIMVDMRLLLAAQHDGIESNPELIEFYEDPELFFARRGVKRIYRLGPGNSAVETLFTDPPPRSNRSNSKQDPYTVDAFPNPEKEKALYKASLLQYHGGLGFFVPHFDWEFRVFNRDSGFQAKNILLDIEQLLTDARFDFAAILRDPELVQKVRDMYKVHLSGDLNWTSSIVRSYPVVRGKVLHKAAGKLEAMKAKCSRWYIRENANGETLLTGDIPTDECFFDQVVMPYISMADYFPEVISVPHHGAKVKSDEGLRKLYDHVKKNGFPVSILVVSFGLTNHYGHPNISSYSAYTDQLPAGFPVVRLVNERRDYSYTVFYE